MDDWELLIALMHHSDGFAGVVTSDARMLGQPRELAALQQTGLSMVVAEGSGHDPVKATGLVLTHITHIAGQIARKKSQIWALSSHAPRPKGPRDYLGIIASNDGKSIDQAFGEARLDEATLRRNPLGTRVKLWRRWRCRTSSPSSKVGVYVPARSAVAGHSLLFERATAVLVAINGNGAV